MATAKARIKKYGNRRLYDTSSSRYVNLEEIARMVRDGTEVEVLDARTGEDVTRVILTQIIVEEARDQKRGLPLQLLRELVVASEDVYKKAQESFQAGITGARQAVTNPFELVRHWIAGNPPPGADAAEVEELRRRVLELEQKLARRTTRRKRASR